MTEPVTFVIFGGAGDLAHRKLLPALYNLFLDGLLPPHFAVVAAARAGLTDEAYREFAKDGVTRFSRRTIDEDVWQKFALSLFFVRVSLEEAGAFATLGSRLDVIEHERGLPGNRIYYLAVPASMFVPTVEQLAQANFVARGDTRPFSRLIVEKPIGRDLASAQTIDDALGRVFDERQIYRIDHYLGKETVQNILALRFANSVFEPLFNQKYVDHVQIAVAEEEGVGTRAGYYDQAGALRDMIQNHLLQLLTLVAMEPPYALDADAVRDEKLEVIRSLRPMTAELVDQHVTRGQYAAGFDLDRPVASYQDEAGVGPASRTETFVALQVFVDNWRWAGVPFFLRTAKRLPRRVSEISVHLKDVPPILFNMDRARPLDANALVLRIQPDEGLSLRIMSKVPGPHVQLYPVNMEFKYNRTFGGSPPEAYERLLLDVVEGDATLFMRRDAVEAAWRWVMPILDRWAARADERPAPYAAGSWGPAEADRLIEATGRRWDPL
jgi:glucose-6-phosphate 1-dehydrogenase